MLHHALSTSLPRCPAIRASVNQGLPSRSKLSVSKSASSSLLLPSGTSHRCVSHSRLSLLWNPQVRCLTQRAVEEGEPIEELSSMTSSFPTSLPGDNPPTTTSSRILKSVESDEEKRKRKARVEAIAAQREFHDLRRPHEWYPIARGMKRHIIMHVGPTNSGKTHTALQRLKEAKKGVYCGPLRLLAEQVFERLNLEGVPCDLVTGEKVIRMDAIEPELIEELALKRRDKEGDEESLDDDEKREEALLSLYSTYDENNPISTSHPRSSSAFSSSTKSHTGHVSCTVEMTDVREEVDVALIDEYQLIGDESRGWAWTRALLGVPAKEIHLCGDTSAIELVRQLLAPTGDEITVKHYDRLSPLSVSSHSLASPSYRPILTDTSKSKELRSVNGKGSSGGVNQFTSSPRGSLKHFDFENHRKFEWIRHLRDGDAVIVFSRKAVFQYKKEIEERLGKSVCVVYGSLPPETRSQQAKRFNSSTPIFGEEDVGLGPDGDERIVSQFKPKSQSQISKSKSQISKSKSSSNQSESSNPSHPRILVATDAIGLGLNLNIRRIIFTALTKFDGIERRELRASEVRQIGGRAGRFLSLYPHGEVTAIDMHGVPFIRQAFNAPVQPQGKAGLFPTFEHIQRFQSALANYIVEHSAANAASVQERSAKSKAIQKMTKQGRKLSGASVADLRDQPGQYLEKTKRTLFNHLRRGGSLPEGILKGDGGGGIDSDVVTQDSPYTCMIHESCDAESEKYEGERTDDSHLFEMDPHLFGVSEPRISHDRNGHLAPSSSPSLAMDIDTPMPDIKLGEILDVYEEIANLSGLFFLCSSDDHKRLAEAIDHLDLSLREKYTFVLAPTNSEDAVALEFFTRFASLFSKGYDVPAPSIANMASVVIGSIGGGGSRVPPRAGGGGKDLENSFRKERVLLRHWEQMYKILDVYLWLSYRFEGFVGVDDALESKSVIEKEITNLLDFNPFPDGGGPNTKSPRKEGRDRVRRIEREARHNPPMPKETRRRKEFENGHFGDDMILDDAGHIKFKRRGDRRDNGGNFDAGRMTLNDPKGLFQFGGENGTEFDENLDSLITRLTSKKSGAPKRIRSTKTSRSPSKSPSKTLSNLKKTRKYL